MQNTVASIVQQGIETKPGHRLVPATIERGEHRTTVYIECPTWCAEDHLGESVSNVEDVMHRTRATFDGAITVPSVSDAPYPIQVFAYVEADPIATNPLMQAAHVTVEDPVSAKMAFLTPDMADKLADDVIGFASHLRHLARTARLANQAGDSGPNMDEALRRVREGARGWQTLTGDDIASLPTARLLKAFGVTVVDADVEVTELHGLPGRMELRVPAAASVQARESDARRLLAHSVGVALNAEATK
ncbi:DUF6907 domain-containing protein [Streptomyces olivaceus]|uniref:DUF6907 domain-containing protein n=1 Tax=Streptomyces olivaceus TaxID=47716 RepID=UPI00382262E9